MADFNQAIDYILSVEGGYVNNPADPGGETNWGITKATAQGWGYDGSMRAMDQQTAGQIYLDLFWNPWNLSAINNQGVANAVMNLHINGGWAAGVIQKALASLGWTGAQDGQWGPQTLAGVNSVDPKAFVDALSAYAADKYRAIVAAKPSLVVFLNGWLNRAAGLANQVVEEITQDVSSTADTVSETVSDNPGTTSAVLALMILGIGLVWWRG